MPRFVILRWEGHTKWSFAGIVDAADEAEAAARCKSDSVLFAWADRQEVAVEQQEPITTITAPKDPDAQKPTKELDRLEAEAAAAEIELEPTVEMDPVTPPSPPEAQPEST